jgi:ribonuclease Z
MEVTLLGTGGPIPDPQRQGPSVLVRANQLKILVDAGRGVSTQLAKVGVSPLDLGVVLITHLHFDHIGALGDVMMSAWNLGRTEPLPIVGPRGLSAVVDALVGDVFALDVRFRKIEAAHSGVVMPDPGDVFVVTEVDEGVVWESDGVVVEATIVNHGDTLELEGWTALAYKIHCGGRTLVMSGDAVPSPGLIAFAAKADLLMQCCYLGAGELKTESEVFLTTEILGGSREAAQVAQLSEPGALVLTHFRQKSQEELVAIHNEVSAALTCRVVMGSDLLTLEV